MSSHYNRQTYLRHQLILWSELIYINHLPQRSRLHPRYRTYSTNNHSNEIPHKKLFYNLTVLYAGETVQSAIVYKQVG